MAIHSLEHLSQYREKNIRRVVPLALALLCISNPKVNVMDTLSKLSYDSVSKVDMAAIVSLGLIGLGTNNARIAGMLYILSSYYYKEANLLFYVWISQGHFHLGKGLFTLSPNHSKYFLLSPQRAKDPGAMFVVGATGQAGIHIAKILLCDVQHKN